MVAPRKTSSENSREAAGAVRLGVTGASDTVVDIVESLQNIAAVALILTYSCGLLAYSVNACINETSPHHQTFTVRRRTLLSDAGHIAAAKLRPAISNLLPIQQEANGAIGCPVALSKVQWISPVPN